MRAVRIVYVAYGVRFSEFFLRASCHSLRRYAQHMHMCIRLTKGCGARRDEGK